MQLLLANLLAFHCKLTLAEREREINRCQFYQALVDSLKRRLLGETEKKLFAAVSVFDPSLLPSEIAPEHGERELKQLCDKFKVGFSDAKEDYRDFKDSRGRDVKLVLKKLMNRVYTIPVSTADCERGFSKMNIVCTPVRSQLTVEHLSSLMFVSLNGPPLQTWEPMKYVKSWLAKNRRDATCMQCPKRKPPALPAAEDNRLLSLWGCCSCS